MSTVLAEIGSGLKLETLDYGEEIQSLRSRSDRHYLFSAAEDLFNPRFPPPGINAIALRRRYYVDISDKYLCRTHVPRGRISVFWDKPKRVENQTKEALDAGPTEVVDPFMMHVITAADQVEDLFRSYGSRGVTILRALIAETPEVVAEIEKALLPEVPVDLIEMMKELHGPALERAEALQGRLRELALATLADMQSATVQATDSFHAELNITEREQERALKSGVGKLALDRRDIYYFTQLRRKPRHADMSNGAVITQPNSSIGLPPASDNNILLQRVVSLEQKLAEKEQLPVETKECSYCAETIKAKAKFCRWCSHSLEEPTIEQASKDKKK